MISLPSARWLRAVYAGLRLASIAYELGISRNRRVNSRVARLDFVSYMKSLVANPIEFYSCFIRYSTKDQEFAGRLHGDLQRKMKGDFSLQAFTFAGSEREGKKRRPAPFKMTVAGDGRQTVKSGSLGALGMTVVGPSVPRRPEKG